MTYAELPVDVIDPNPEQPRRHFAPEALDELAKSIRQIGLLEPVIVHPTDSGRWLLVAGERRWRASQMAPLSIIPARILEGLSDEEAFVRSMAENLTRADMTLTEEARGFATLVGFGQSPEQIGKQFGKTASYVTWRMGLLGLTDELAALVDAGTMTPTAGYYAAKLSPAGQQVFAGRYVRGEFRTDAEAKAAARAYAMAEAQTEFWADQDFDPERRRAAAKAMRSLAAAHRRRLQQLAGELEAVGAGDVTEWAMADSELRGLLDAIDTALAAGRAAAARLRQANAIADLKAGVS